MTYEEASAALSADDAAIVWAGQDFDALAAGFHSTPGGAVSAPILYPGAPTWAHANPDAVAVGIPTPADAEAERVVAAARKSIDAAADMPSRLVAIRDGIATLTALALHRETGKANAAIALAERQRRFAEDGRAHQASQARRERMGRATFPAIVNMRGRINAVAHSIGEPETADALAIVLDALAKGLADDLQAMRDVGGTILPKAA